MRGVIEVVYELNVGYRSSVTGLNDTGVNCLCSSNGPFSDWDRQSLKEWYGS